MLTWIKKRTANRANATELYGRVVTQARLPQFYADYGVPDTTEGRFGMLALHLWLPLERLRDAGAEGAGLSRLAIEAFVADMDDCMREMGVGDMSVPRKVKGAAAEFYARATACRTALQEADDEALSSVMRAQLGDGVDSGGLARYVRDAVAGFTMQPMPALLAGEAVFPNPSDSNPMEARNDGSR